MTKKEMFPFFKNNDSVYLDSAATTQKPATVLDALNKAYVNASNIGRSSYPLATSNGMAFEKTRDMVAKFLNARPNQVVFTFSSTDSINFVASSIELKKDEYMLTSVLEHHSNYLPFLNKFGKKVLVCGAEKNGDIDLKEYERILKEKKVKFVSITGFSNVIGRLQDIKNLVSLAHRFGAKILIDATQLIAHNKIDVQKIDCDFLVFSTHKIYGPNGGGVLYMKEYFKNNYRLGGGTVSDVINHKADYVEPPHIYEAGTFAIPEIIALNESISFISKVNDGYSKPFVSYLKKELASLGAVILGQPLEGNITFYFKNISSYDISLLLGQKKIMVRAGNHCCAPLHHHYDAPATVRVSFGIYNDMKDCQAFVKGLKEVVKILCK
ncbi:MAG: aminotransferase class V-fold PLP-dependent enzyme [Rickettsiales bacterium]|jgi:cysteine desulfurase/selenocysteine lyase|nr:aminotransferase class V-fold PLP-dependent enzyme [Rickettsiales bacterium]